jgi:hypothetical protein
MMDNNNISGKEKGPVKKDDRISGTCWRTGPSQLVAAVVTRRSRRSRPNGARPGIFWATDEVSLVFQNPPRYGGGYGAICAGLAANWEEPNRETSMCKSLIFQIFLAASARVFRLNLLTLPNWPYATR